MKWILVPMLLLVATGALAEAPGLSHLVDQMTGSFSSEELAAEDDSFYDIRLEMWPIWNDRDDGRWLYVEQAVAGMTDRPYRQRVYHVVQVGDEKFESAVYTLPEPENHVGAWQDDNPLGDLTPDDLTLREGCTVYLEYDDFGRYTGGTEGDGCASSLRGATYATSSVVISPERVVSWDRGYDRQGVQVWGAEDGPYIFQPVK